MTGAEVRNVTRKSASIRLHSLWSHQRLLPEVGAV